MLTGEKLGRYKIGRMIGAGGMGEVYIARDEQLDRDVALKVLLAEFCSQAERVNRFKFEAKAVSALNHPNIITIHEIAEIDEKLFIATEFIDGKTLRERIEAKDLDTYEVVKIAEQVADALAIAHEANIVHRDIKPENIMVRKDGYSKILDFGLAKPIFQGVSDKEDATLQLVKTQPGLVMGSVRYMSPEQARGKETDGRTDVWSLGVTLYEMLTGENPFDGETISDSLAAVIHKEPKPLKDVPKDLSWMIEKALNKNPAERYQNIRDFALDLRDMRLGLERDSVGHENLHTSKSISLTKQNTSENKTLIHQTISADNPISTETQIENKTQVNTISIPKRRLYLPVALISLLAVIGLSGWYFAPNLFGKTEVPFQNIKVSLLTDSGDASRGAVSPDGKMVVFVEYKKQKGRLLLKQIASGGTVEIVPWTAKGFLLPRFSPDGEFVFYSTYDNGVGTLFKIPALGGESVEIVNDIDSEAAISPDGTQIAFKRHSTKKGGDEIILINEKGENPQPIAATKTLKLDEFRDVVWSGDGKKLLLVGFVRTEDQGKKFSANILDVESKQFEEPRWLKDFNEANWWFTHSFNWLSDNSGILFVGMKLKTDHFQIYHLEFASNKLTKITNDISEYDSLSVSKDGKTFVTQKSDYLANLISYNPQTKERTTLLDDNFKNNMGGGFSQTASNKILYSKWSGEKRNIVEFDIQTNDEKVLLSEKNYYTNPILTSDGEYLIYKASNTGISTIWRANADGTDPIELTKSEVGTAYDLELSPDDKYVYFTREKSDRGKSDILRVPVEGGEVESLFPDNQESERNLKFSPNGDFVAYNQNYFDDEKFTMISFVKVAKFAEGKISEPISELPIGLDAKFLWSLDSKFITYAKRDVGFDLWNISVDGKKEIQLSNLESESIQHFRWSNDGKKLLIAEGNVNGDLILIKDTENNSE